jgi:hypothetical protein
VKDTIQLTYGDLRKKQEIEEWKNRLKDGCKNGLINIWADDEKSMGV